MSRQALRRRRVCRGKRRFPSLHAAEKFARSYRVGEGLERDAFTAYSCSGCGGAHVGHTPLKIRQDLWAERVVER